MATADIRSRLTAFSAARYLHALHSMNRIPCAVAALAAVLLSGCAGRSVPDTVEPAVAAEVVASTAPDRPLRVIFSWRALERDARFDGSGAARLEAPYRARLDLFGPTGDGYLSAALVEQELRLPAGTPPVRLPPPAMMWAVLGVVAPPPRAVLRGTRMDVRLEGSAEHGLPRRAVFRDFAAHTELELNLEQVDEVEPYPPDIWSPGR